MQPIALVLSSVLVIACGGTTPPQPSSPASPPAATTKAPPDAHAATVDAMVGVWYGKAVGTPIGDFPFALAFDREAGGDVHAHVDDGRGMTLDFRFRRQKGSWILIETGTIPGAGTQSKTLAPITTSGGTRWVDGDVAIDLAVTAETLVMTTTLDGEPHAIFQLQRAHGPAADQIRQAIARGPRGVAE